MREACEEDGCAEECDGTGEASEDFGEGLCAFDAEDCGYSEDDEGCYDEVCYLDDYLLFHCSRGFSG